MTRDKETKMPKQNPCSYQARIHSGTTRHLPLALIFAASMLLLSCAGNDFESGVLVETQPCENNTSPWNGLNDFKIRNDDGSLTVFKCHYTAAISEEDPCPGVGDPMCEFNWQAIRIGMSASELQTQLGEPLNISGLRWQYPNNNSVTVDDGEVVNIFQRSASLYTSPPL